MKKNFRFVFLATLVVLVVLSVYSAISPKGEAQDFSFQNSPSCDFSVSSDRINNGLNNFAHLKGFFFMSLIAFFAFRKRPVLGTFLFVFGLTFVTEALQMWSLSRHCRFVDAIPNFLGFALAMGIMWLSSKMSSHFEFLKGAKDESK